MPNTFATQPAALASPPQLFPPAIGESSGRLGGALLAYMLTVVLVVTLAPFRFTTPEHLHITLAGGLADIAANIALFVPLGFLWRLTHPAPTDRRGLHVLSLGLLFSAAIEIVQIVEPDRYASLPDVLANGMGAWVGGMAHSGIVRRLRFGGAMAGRLALELPLMGLVYLLVPLLWLSGFGVGTEPFRLLLLLLLGLFGGRLLGVLQRHHFGPAATFSPRGVALAAGGGFLLGALPSTPAWLLPVLLIALLVVGFTWRRASASPVTGDRRFEGAALRSAAPLYAGYLLLLACAPLDGAAGWQAGWELPGGASGLANLELFRLLETVGAFTLLGYMVAEARGRWELPYAQSVGWLLLSGGFSAALAELLQGVAAPSGASASRLVLLVLATLYGGWLYHLQRDHVRRLIRDARAAEHHR